MAKHGRPLKMIMGLRDVFENVVRSLVQPVKEATKGGDVE